MKRNKTMWSIHRRKKSVKRNCPQGSQMLDLLNKDLNYFKYIPRTTDHHI